MSPYERHQVASALQVKIKRMEGSRGRVTFVTESLICKPDEIEMESILAAYRSAAKNMQNSQEEDQHHA